MWWSPRRRTSSPKLADAIVVVVVVDWVFRGVVVRWVLRRKHGMVDSGREFE